MPASTVHTTIGPSRVSTSAVTIAVVSSVAVLAILAALHVASPEFDPAWRMVSEYANGRYPWLLSLMFLIWAVSTWALAAAIMPLGTSGMEKAGLVVLTIAGVGEAMAAAFDINHALHGAAAFLGVLGLPIAAMLLGVSLTRRASWSAARPAIRALSHLTWISVVLMGASFAMFIAALKQAGVEVAADSTPLTELPPGVVAFTGWANRLLIVIYCAWTIVVARQAASSETAR